MKITILQSFTSPLPINIIGDCIKTVKEFCDINNYDYKHMDLSEMLNYNFTYWSSASDLFRVNYLAYNPYTLWVDWDVALKNHFQLPEDLDQPMKAKDFIMWNGDRTDIFLNVLEIYAKYEKEVGLEARKEKYRIWKCLKQTEYMKIPEFDKSTYDHVDWRSYK